MRRFPVWQSWRSCKAPRIDSNRQNRNEISRCPAAGDFFCTPFSHRKSVSAIDFCLQDSLRKLPDGKRKRNVFMKRVYYRIALQCYKVVKFCSYKVTTLMKTKDVERILQNLMLASGQKIVPEKTLIIFDEVQFISPLFLLVSRRGGRRLPRKKRVESASLSTLKTSLCEISPPSTSQHVPW